MLHCDELSNTELGVLVPPVVPPPNRTTVLNDLSWVLDDRIQLLQLLGLASILEGQLVTHMKGNVMAKKKKEKAPLGVPVPPKKGKKK
jgi:hypothetical protein